MKAWERNSNRASLLAADDNKDGVVSSDDNTLLTKVVSKSNMQDVAGSEDGIAFLVSTIYKDQLGEDPNMFAGETEMSQSLCFKEELKLLNQHEPQPFPVSNELRVVRAVRTKGTSGDLVTLALAGVVYLEDADSAMDRFSHKNLYKDLLGCCDKRKYDGLFLSGLCRFSATKGIGKRLLYHCIQHARSLQKKLFLSVFNADADHIRFSHDKLVTYYRAHGFEVENEYVFRGGPFKYTIMVLDTNDGSRECTMVR